MGGHKQANRGEEGEGVWDLRWREEGEGERSKARFTNYI